MRLKFTLSMLHIYNIVTAFVHAKTLKRQIRMCLFTSIDNYFYLYYAVYAIRLLILCGYNHIFTLIISSNPVSFALAATGLR